MMKRKIKKEETVANILKISEKLFYEQGYENTSISQIAKECNLSKGALYHHFASKQEVLEKICHNHYNFIKEQFLPIAKKNSLSMYARILQIMSIARSWQMNTAATTFAKTEKADSYSAENAALNQLLDKYHQKIYLEVFSSLLEEGKQNQECSFPCSAKTIAGLIYNLDNGTTQRLNDIIYQEKSPQQKKMLNDAIDGFVFALAQILNMDNKKVAKMVLAAQMKKIYKSILTKV